MTAQAPPTWLEDLATADTRWVFDGTGLSDSLGFLPEFVSDQ
jgi:hypothetical protein